VPPLVPTPDSPGDKNTTHDPASVTVRAATPVLKDFWIAQNAPAVWENKMPKTVLRMMLVVASFLFATCGSLLAQPSGFSFTPPPANQCQSQYDKFYENEPGVYGFWALCEPTPAPVGGKASPYKAYDYVGQWDLPGGGYLSKATGVMGGATGPVSDGETAAYVTNQGSTIENQGIVLNARQGSMATWVKASGLPTGYITTVMTFFNINGLKSKIELGAIESGGDICFSGTFVNSAGTSTVIQNSTCYAPSVWHRVVVTWDAGSLNLYVDGTTSPVTGTYTGTLDNFDFFYNLFDQCCTSSTISLSMAKSLIANSAWSQAQVTTDYAPGAFASIPTGGVYIDWTTLGEIHKDILGYADTNQDISTTADVTNLSAGLTKAGVTSLRYANGYDGITADEENWQGGDYCAFSKGTVTPTAATNISTNNTLSTYIPQVAQTLGLDIGFTVNYGSNPPACNAGGDPTLNGANLVTYANVTNNYNIKYWEIGNEVYSTGSELDLHSNPNTGSSYVANEPAFYTAMKAVDSSILIAVPAAITPVDISWAEKFTLPVLAGASYDAVVSHNYPVHDPNITDGNTLYSDYVQSTLGRTLGELKTLQTALLSAGKSPGAIWITEWDDEDSGNMWSKQTIGAVMPMFVISQLAQYMEAGVQYATWFAQGGSNVCTTANEDPDAPTAYSWWNCGDSNLVYTDDLGQSGSQVNVGFNLGDITPAARGFQLLSESGFVSDGEKMLRTQSDVVNAPWLLTYAATHGTNYAVILMNRDYNSSHVVPVSLKNRSSGHVDVYSYSLATQYNPTQPTAPSGLGNWEVEPTVTTNVAWTGMYQPNLPPWTVQVLMFH
jgi:Concanavalin A-like lectin/glucanases superfamily